MDLLCAWMCPLTPPPTPPRSSSTRSCETRSCETRSSGTQRQRAVRVNPFVRIRWVPRATAHQRGVPPRRVTRALRPDIVRYTSRDPENTLNE